MEERVMVGVLKGLLDHHELEEVLDRLADACLDKGSEMAETGDRGAQWIWVGRAMHVQELAVDLREGTPREEKEEDHQNIWEDWEED
jgi:hypothetical protein